MKKDIAQAWRNGLHALQLTDDERAALPESPAGVVQVDDEALSSIAGGCNSGKTSAICTPCPPRHCF